MLAAISAVSFENSLGRFGCGGNIFHEPSAACYIVWNDTGLVLATGNHCVQIPVVLQMVCFFVLQ